MTTNISPLLSLERAIALITQRIADLESSAFQQDGFAELSMRQVYYLESIARMGHPSFSELAEALKISRPSVTNLVAKLIRGGYVQKVQDGEDHRSFHIILTQKGQGFTQIHQKIHKRIVEALTHHLDEAEIAQLAALLEKAEDL
jgi:DNA-binding MarR family transcriptional regulator